MLALQFFQRSIGIISLIILARLLTPEDFGVVAVAVAIYAVMTDSTRFNAGAAIIQFSNVRDSHVNTAWTLSLIRGMVLFLVLITVSVVLSQTSENGSLPIAVLFVAFLPLIEGFSNSGFVLFEKEINYKPRAIVGAVSKFLGFITTIGLAWLYQAYWVMLAGMLVTSFSGVALSYLLCTFRPRLGVSEWRSLLSFTGWLTGAHFLGSLSNRIEVFLIGANLSLKDVGIYNMGAELGRMVQSHLVYPSISVLYPGLAKNKDNLLQLSENYLRARRVLISVLVPLSLGVALVAEQLVPLLLGEGWGMAVPVVITIACNSTIYLYTVGFDQVLLARGQTRLLFKRQLIVSVIRIVCASAGLFLGGIFGLLGGLVIGNLFMLLININLLLSTLEIDSKQLMTGAAPAFFGLIAMTGSLYGLDHWLWLDQMNLLLVLVIKVVAGACAYTLTHAAFWLLSGKKHGLETELITFINRKMGH